MRETNKHLQQEYNAFIDASNSNMRRRRRAAPPRRRKRFAFIPFIAGGAIGGGLLASAKGHNPFHWIGEGVGGFFGLASARDLRMTQAMLVENSFQLAMVKINQIQITGAIEGLIQHLTRLERLIRFQEHDVAIIYGELDSKIAMRYLQSVIQMTLLKVHASMMAARSFSPSPYVFGQSDLRNLTTDHRYFRHKMTTSIDDVATALVVVEDKFTFLIAVPIKDEKSQFWVYKINQLPVFNDDKTYKVVLSSSHYAINPSTNLYIPITDTDYRQCIERPLCATQAPIFTITSKSPCEISSFIYDTQKCPLEIAHPMGPSFLNYGNTTFYSVPEKLTVNVRCIITSQAMSRHENIDGIGSFQAHTGCITQISEQAHIRPMHIAEIHNLDGDSIFGILKQFDKKQAIYPKEPSINTTTMRPPTILEVNNFSEGIKLLLNVQTNSTDVVRTLLILVFLLIIFLLIYACIPQFKLWFNDCCSFTKPHKYWGQKYANVPQFVKIHKPDNNTFRQKLQKFCNRIRNICRSNDPPVQPTHVPNIEEVFDFQQPIYSNSRYPTINVSNI